MKKLTTALLLIGSLAQAEVLTFLPYGGQIYYDKSSANSIKDSATLAGIHGSYGNLRYLVEVDYAHINSTYKDTTIENLKQDDITVAYGYYWQHMMVRAGVHYINTNDPLLGNGIVGFGSVGGYKFFGYNKFSYGIEGYYSNYKDAVNVNGVKQAVNITQITPYISYYKAININWGNIFYAKVNYQITPSAYPKQNYTSFEIGNTLYYKKFYLLLRGYGGEMRTGVKDSGYTVFNSLDLYKNGYGAKIGYTINQNIACSVRYDINNYQEVDVFTYKQLPQGSNSVWIASFTYGF